MQLTSQTVTQPRCSLFGRSFSAEAAEVTCQLSNSSNRASILKIAPSHDLRQLSEAKREAPETGAAVLLTNPSTSRCFERTHRIATELKYFFLFTNTIAKRLLSFERRVLFLKEQQSVSGVGALTGTRLMASRIRTLEPKPDIWSFFARVGPRRRS